MIKTFSTLFAGHVDFEDRGQYATPVNERTAAAIMRRRHEREPGDGQRNQNFEQSEAGCLCGRCAHH